MIEIKTQSDLKEFVSILNTYSDDLVIWKVEYMTNSTIQDGYVYADNSGAAVTMQLRILDSEDCEFNNIIVEFINLLELYIVNDSYCEWSATINEYSERDRINISINQYGNIRCNMIRYILQKL